MKQKNFINNNKKIYYYEWCDAEKPKGIVQIAHGMAEHAQRYDKIAKQLEEAGYLVFASDHRAHGKTDENNLGFSEGDIFNQTVEDLYELYKIVKKKHPKLPYFLLGHSYGSFLAQSFLEKYPSSLNGLVLCGSNKNPKAITNLGKVVAWFGKIFKGGSKPAKLIKKITFDSYDKKFKTHNFLSSHPESNNTYKESPFCGFICSHSFYYSFFKGLGKLYSKKSAKNINPNLPILIISGKDDPVGEMGKGVERLSNYYHKIGYKDVELTLLANKRHEFFNEVEGEILFQNVINFLDRQI